MGGSRINQAAVPDPGNVAKALNGRCVEGQQGGPVEPDAIPKRIPDDFSGAGGQRGSGAIVFGSTHRQVFAWSQFCVCPPAAPLTLVLRLPPKRERPPDTARSSLGTWWRAAWPGHRTTRNRTRSSEARGARWA